MTVKRPRTGIARHEFEYEIPCEGANCLLDMHCQEQTLEKTRHIVAHAGLEWAVDVYVGILAGVTIAEVEVDYPDQRIELPGWVGEGITGRALYRKVNMLKARQSR